MRYLSLLFLSLIMAASASAQTAGEALRYSNLTFGGTARGMGVAGAFGALGGDQTSVLINPAGIGVYRSSELVISPSAAGTTVNSNYSNSRTEDSRLSGSLANMHLVYSHLLEDRRGNRMYNKWVAVNFGFGINRLANFNSDRFYGDMNTNNSVLEGYANELEGVPAADLEYGPQSFSSVLSYDAFLLNPLSTNDAAFSYVTRGLPLDQEVTFETRGGIDEINLTVGANYDNKLYFGAYIGIPLLNYDETLTITERNTNDSLSSFDGFTLENKLNTAATGINAKIGFIYRPHKLVRFGLSVQSPTRYSMRDEFEGNISSNFDTANYVAFSPFGEFDYKLITPWRFTASVAVLLKKRGFISADYELVDYSAASFDLGSGFTSVEDELNRPIQNIYTIGHNIRVGTEIVIEKFRLRAGAAYYGNPLDNPSALGVVSQETMSYTGGLGLRFEKFFIDLAYVRSKTEVTEVFINNVGVSDEIVRNNVVATVGFRFGN